MDTPSGGQQWPADRYQPCEGTECKETHGRPHGAGSHPHKMSRTANLCRRKVASSSGGGEGAATVQRAGVQSVDDGNLLGPDSRRGIIL